MNTWMACAIAGSTTGEGLCDQHDQYGRYYSNDGGVGFDNGYYYDVVGSYHH